MDAFCAGEKNAYTTLDASGLSVGLPAGLMGNSEVGHLNIGAGRVVYQVKPLLEYYACKNLLYIVRAHLDVHSLTLVWSKWNVIKPNWKAASPWQAIYSTCSWPFVDAASFKAMILEVVLGFEFGCCEGVSLYNATPSPSPLDVTFWSKRATVFHRWARLVELNFCIGKIFFQVVKQVKSVHPVPGP